MLLQADFNYRERGMTTLCFLPEVIAVHCQQPKIQSRIGLSKTPVILKPHMDLVAYVRSFTNSSALSCILIDEAQFLTKAHVGQLARIVDEMNIPVLAFGLRTDFRGELFEGSLYLLAWADHLEELRTVCFCGSKATMTARMGAAGTAVVSGDQLECGGNEKYVSLCRKHHRDFRNGLIDRNRVLGR